MMEGVDYSYSHPDPAQLAAGGKRFAVRYVGVNTPGKALTVSEVRALRDVGIDLVAVYETTAGFMLNENGAMAARRAYDHARSLGMPKDRPIYFALDIDPRNIDSQGWSYIYRFLNDAAGEIGLSRIGVYGGWHAIDMLVDRHAVYGWQTYAWSSGRVHSRAHLYQYRNGVALAGGTVDLCKSLTPDFGQWSYTTTTPEQKRDEDMAHMVQSKDSGAVLLITGNAAVLIRNNAQLQAHQAAGIELIPVDGTQFKHYETLRANGDKPVPMDISINPVDVRLGIEQAIESLTTSDLTISFHWNP